MFRTDLDVVEEVMGSSGAAARERHGAEALTNNLDLKTMM